ncbi:MAG: NACHT domain-containing protein [Symploca sp. SIO3C6]|nr:NACHT domain-containing protein [Symploca sp. SIO3C6]
MSQQIASLHKRIVAIQENLERLPTLSGIRTEMARLAAQEEMGRGGDGERGGWGDAERGRGGDTERELSVNGQFDISLASSQDKPCRAIALAQQMRGWFETLGYRFEKYEVWTESFFEWIINIPVRRNRYDRILVRGIEGEAGFGDVMALRQSVARQRTDEGWLITARRIAKAARNEVEKEENHFLGCYTLDELIVQDADFGGYLDWLEAEVKRRKIDQRYVPLACTKEEIDPVTKQQIAVSHYDEEEGWIDGYIDRWLDDPAKEHISILGEFGTGKTWFALHYAWVALQRYRDAQKRGVELPRLPLVIPLRDYAKAVSVESLFSEFFFRQYKIPLPHYDAFVQLNRMGKLLLIFDGFDEMAARVNRQEMINNFWELAKVVVPGAKVILTCRTEHFPEAKEGRALLNAELQASTANLTGETPQFEVLELEKFNDEQIRQVLLFQAEDTTVEEVMVNPQLLDLARRPVMTDLILEALPDIEAGKPVDMSRVYLYAVRRKMERDIKAERTFTSLADKLYFLCELSWEMLSTEQMSINYRLFPDRIRRLFGSVVQEEKDLDHWHYDMMGQTMLIRNAEGDYTPAHRSLLEFFVAYKFAAELGALADDFTELAQVQLDIDNDAASVNYTWSNYFSRQLEQTERSASLTKGGVLPIAPLKAFTSESLEKLQLVFGQASLTKAVIDLLVPMLIPSGNKRSDLLVSERERGRGGEGEKDLSVNRQLVINSYSTLLEILDVTRGKTASEVGYVGGNIVRLLLKIDQTILAGKNLSQAVIWNADFSNASLRHTSFAEADLTDSTFRQILATVYSVAFSPDGKLFATGDGNGEISLRQVKDGQKVLSCQGHTDWVRSVNFSSDGKFLASVGYDQTIRIWETGTGECLKSWLAHTNRINSVVISPDGTTVISSSGDKTIKIWDLKTGKCLRILQGHTDEVNSIALSSDGITLVSGSSDQTLKLWNIHTGACLNTLHGHNHRVFSVGISSNNRILVSGSFDHTIKFWDLETGAFLKTLYGHSDQIRSIVISHDGKTIASGSNDKTVKLWDVEIGKCFRTLHGHTQWVRSVAISPSDQTIISGGDDHSLKLWDIETGECLKTLQGFITAVLSVKISLKGTILISGNEENTVDIWDIKTGERLNTLYGHSGRINSVAISPDSQKLASGSSDKTIKLWDVHTGECLKTLAGHAAYINSVVFNIRGKSIVTGSADKTIKIWDIETGECLHTLKGHTDWIWSVTISTNGKNIASASADKTAKLWDIQTGECLKTFCGHSHYVRSVVISPDDKLLASSSEDHTVRLWDIQTGECLEILTEDTGSVYEEVVFTADGSTLISCGADNTVKLWNINTGECFKTLHGHNQWVTSVAISSDNTLIASGSWDETIKLWDFKTGECLKTLSYERPYKDMNITGVKGLMATEKATLKALGAVEGD